MTQPRRTRLLVAVPAVALLAVSLVGCGLAEDAVKNKAEEAAKSEGVDLNLDDLEDGEINIDTTDGGATVGKLPKTWPTDVPVVDGEVLAGAYTKNPANWNATVEVGPAGGDKNAAFDEAAAALTDAGYTEVTPKTDNGTGIFGDYAGGTYLVKLGVTDSNGIVVNYTVSPK